MTKEQLHTGCLHVAMTLAVFFIGMAINAVTTAAVPMSWYNG